MSEGRLDFLQAPLAADKERQAEEYLLGKVYREPKATQDINRLHNAPGSLFLSATTPPNDSFSSAESSSALPQFSTLELETRLREDPMMVMLREEQKARQAVLNNPLKMARINHAVSQIFNLRHGGNTAASSSSSSSSSRKRFSTSPTSSRPSKRLRSSSPSRYHDPLSVSFSPSASSSPALSKAQKYGLICAADHGMAPSPPLSVPASSSASLPSISSSSHHSHSRSRSRSPPSSSSSFSDSLPTVSFSSRRSRWDAGPPSSQSSISHSSSSSYSLSSSFSSRSSCGGRPARLSEEERAKRLKEMASDADEHAEEQRAHRLREKQKELQELEAARKKAEAAAKGEDGNEGKFLRHLHSSVYTVEAEGSLEERLRRNKHYRQKGDIESAPFLKQTNE